MDAEERIKYRQENCPKSQLGQAIYFKIGKNKLFMCCMPGCTVQHCKSASLDAATSGRCNKCIKKFLNPDNLQDNWGARQYNCMDCQRNKVKKLMHTIDVDNSICNVCNNLRNPKK